MSTINAFVWRAIRAGLLMSLPAALVAQGRPTLSDSLARRDSIARLQAVTVVATPAERVISANTAREVRSMLEGAVSAERATGKAASVPGVRVGGKTGTSDDPDCETCAHSPGTFASFVGIVPIDSPRWVIYVGVGEPSQPGSGGTIAAPAFARIAARGLALEPAR